MQHELRKDYVRDQYVIVSPDRPLPPLPARMTAVGSTTCAICPTRLDATDALYRFPDHGDWHIAVVPKPHGTVFVPDTHRYGTQELVIEVPEHGLHFEDLPEEHIARLFEAYAARIRELADTGKIKYAIVFKNAGGAASGAHAYSQIFGSHSPSEHVLDLQNKVRNYRKSTGRCVWCDVMKQERKTDRLVYEDAFVTVFTPYASKSRYEAYIMPRRHLSGVGELSADERYSVAGAIRRLFKKIAHLRLPSHFSLEETPKDPNQHVFITVAPRDYRGQMVPSGLILNPVSPERAAQFYRE